MPQAPSVSYFYSSLCVCTLQLFLCAHVSMNMYVFAYRLPCICVHVLPLHLCVMGCRSLAATMSPLTWPQRWLSECWSPSALFRTCSQGVRQERISAEDGSMLSELTQDKENELARAMKRLARRNETKAVSYFILQELEGCTVVKVTKMFVCMWSTSIPRCNTEAVVEKQLQRQQNQLQRQHINNEDAPDTLWIIHMQIFFRRHLCTTRLNYLT